MDCIEKCLAQEDHIIITWYCDCYYYYYRLVKSITSYHVSLGSAKMGKVEATNPHPSRSVCMKPHSKSFASNVFNLHSHGER